MTFHPDVVRFDSARC